MSASYPTSVVSFSSKVNGETIEASTINTLQNEVVAIETDLEAGLPAVRGGTGQTLYTTGDLLYASSASALGKLTAAATGKVLVSNGASVAPSWSATPQVTSLSLTDGSTAPSTVAGIAQIYVDTSDGDLKIKFGDGTVKTIVTDT